MNDVAENPPLTLTSHNNTRRQQPSMAPDEELVDPREIDKVVSEVAGMAGRWNLFKKFLSESLRVHIHPFFCLSFSNIHSRKTRKTLPIRPSLPQKFLPWKPPPHIVSLRTC
jgi:hypothetical protein